MARRKKAGTSTRPAEQPAVRPAVKPSGKSVEKMAVKPVEKTATKPTVKPIGKPTDAPPAADERKASPPLSDPVRRRSAEQQSLSAYYERVAEGHRAAGRPAPAAKLASSIPSHVDDAIRNVVGEPVTE